jgi:hypothetical protein
MAVVVQCFHCNAVLELDDGFRGGVCRCGTCGSLLQVPRGEQEAPARRTRPAAPPPAPPAAPGSAAGAPRSANPPSSATDPGISRGPFTPAARRPDPNPGSGVPAAVQNATEADVSSSTLRQIHQTRPVAPAASKKSAKSAPPAGRSNSVDVPVATAAASPAAGKSPTAIQSPPALQELKRTSTLLWVALALCAVLAIIVIASIFSYLNH